MTLSFVLFLFLAHLGIGIVFTLVLVSRVAGVKFFRFNAGFAAALLLVALAMRPDEVTLGANLQGAGLAALMVATGRPLHLLGDDRPCPGLAAATPGCGPRCCPAPPFWRRRGWQRPPGPARRWPP